MHWLIKSKINATSVKKRHSEIIAAILTNRGLTKPQDISDFLNPLPPHTITPKEIGINKKDLDQAKKLIDQAVDLQTPIIVYGDYDADGITATAIMWEALRSLGANTIPFIPSRESHGYGLSIKGLEDAINQIPTTTQAPLIITVDNGIVASDAVTWLKTKHIPIIITDHHQPGDLPPKADVILHSTQICGAGVAWVLATFLNPDIAPQILDLVCIGTISDMMPLIGINRRFVSHGLEAIRTSKRLGLISLMKEAEIDLEKPIDTYHVNYIIAPRLNAMGRLEHALDSLRLLCTVNESRATKLAQLLSSTNRNRQDLTQELLEFATQNLKPLTQKNKILILNDSSFHEGVIGLIAGKLAEKYYRPTIVISRKEGISKASARSIKGINITELIRTQSHLLAGVGGHPMAAGFSIATHQIEAFTKSLIKHAGDVIDEKLLIPTISIDAQITLADINPELYQLVQQLQPFGIGNSQPIFAIRKVPIANIQTMGTAHQHLKLLIKPSPELIIQALWFGHGASITDLKDTKTLDLAFSINQNVWRGHTSLQLIIKDISTARFLT